MPLFLASRHDQLGPRYTSQEMFHALNKVEAADAKAAA